MKNCIFNQSIFFICCMMLFVSGTVPAQQLKLPEPLKVLPSQNPAKVEIGKALFFDRRLSGDGTVSCAVCHIPDEAFADGQKISVAYPTNKHWRHTNSLLNVGYLDTFFWDGRSKDLEDQALGPIHTSFEMNLNPRYLVAKLREIPDYQLLFQKAWGGHGHSGENCRFAGRF